MAYPHPGKIDLLVFALYEAVCPDGQKGRLSCVNTPQEYPLNNLRFQPEAEAAAKKIDKTPKELPDSAGGHHIEWSVLA